MNEITVELINNSWLKIEITANYGGHRLTYFK